MGCLAAGGGSRVPRWRRRRRALACWDGWQARSGGMACRTELPALVVAQCPRWGAAKPHLLARLTGLDWPAVRVRSPLPRSWVVLDSCCIAPDFDREARCVHPVLGVAGAGSDGRSPHCSSVRLPGAAVEQEGADGAVVARLAPCTVLKKAQSQRIGWLHSTQQAPTPSTWLPIEPTPT